MLVYSLPSLGPILTTTMVTVDFRMRIIVFFETPAIHHLSIW
jgi:hypothetical protein